MIEKIISRLEEERKTERETFNDEFSKGVQLGYAEARKIVQEVAKEYEEKKLCRIALVCLEDTTSLEMELTEQEYLFLERITDAVNKIAIGCMSTMYVEQKGE